MIISGIVMASKRGKLTELEGEVSELPWADAHFSDESGRLVVTIEAESIEQSMDRVGVLQGLPSTMMAELAQYCMEEEDFTPGDDPASDSEAAVEKLNAEIGSSH
jgi:nitrate reductase NapAB chaperone NapD